MLEGNLVLSVIKELIIFFLGYYMKKIIRLVCKNICFIVIYIYDS